MAEIRVTSATLTQKKGELDQLNGQLTTLKGQYEQVESAMNSKWEGDAKNAFHATFLQNMQAVDTFIKAVQQYSAVLQEIIAKYESTEAKNAATGGSR